MGAYQRFLATSQVATTAALTVAAAVVSGYHSAPGGRSAFVVAAAALMPVFALLTVVAAVLWHHAEATPSATTVPRPARRPVRALLRVVAATGMGGGVLLIGTALTFMGGLLLVQPHLSPSELFYFATATLICFGVICLGGLLWCAVRVAYPDGTVPVLSIGQSGESQPPAAEKSA